MLEREHHNVLQSLESIISLPVANTLSDDDLNPPKVLGCIGPHLCEHLRMERREPKLAKVVGFVDVYIWISRGDVSLKKSLRELMSGASCVSIEGLETGRVAHQSLEAMKDLD